MYNRMGHVQDGLSDVPSAPPIHDYSQEASPVPNCDTKLVQMQVHRMVQLSKKRNMVMISWELTFLKRLIGSFYFSFCDFGC
jgi:type IV secretory pathway TrbF-like protein